MEINEFRGRYYFLSNFFNSKITLDINPIGKLTFNNGEAAFHACKDLTRAREFVNLDPSEAKKLGRRVHLRPDWEVIKEDIMYEIVKAKFSQNKLLKQRLLDTGYSDLTEGNTWHDNYWGSCSCSKCKNKHKGNALGRILMRVRKEFMNEKAFT